jgi:chemotaxis protein histidine kinase CheA/CheY-like chemotaxis protein
MDWAESEELMGIYFSEVDQRSEALVEGASALSDGSADPGSYDDLIRDAHTLKGSSHMVGKPDVGDASAVLEKAWKRIHELGHTRDTLLGPVMLELSTLLRSAAREPEAAASLTGVAQRLESLLEDESAEPPPDSTDVESASDPDLSADGFAPSESPEPTAPEPPTVEPSDAPVDAPADEMPVAGATSESDIPMADFMAPPITGPIRFPSTTDMASSGNQLTLGGLLPSLEGELEGSVMRVDTGALYTLINRVVEIGIELQSLDDLALVSFSGDTSRMLAGWRAQIARVSNELADLKDDAVSLVNVPLSEAIETFPQFVRFLGRRLGKHVRLDIEGADIQLDRQIVDLLREPLRHLIVNAVDHGLETEAERLAAGKPPTGVVRLSAEIEEDRLILSVGDDGKGVDWGQVRARAESEGLPSSPSELRSHLLRSGFTTEPTVTDFSGTGEGLALLADAVDRVSGSVMIHSVPGSGTTIMVDLPVSLVLQRIVSITSGDQVFGLSEAAVIDTVSPIGPHLRSKDTGDELSFENERIPFVSLSAGVGIVEQVDDSVAIVLSTRSGLVAVGVGEVLGQRSVAVKGVGPILEGADHIAGAAFLGGGQVLVVVDHNHLGALARRSPDHTSDRPRVLVVDDSAGVRQLIGATLRGNGFEVEVAANGAEALGLLDSRNYDALVVDYSMPGSNGADLVRTIRSSAAALPIVMVSGVAEQEDKARAWDAGVDAYLDKYDLRRGALTESIQRLLSERSPRHV